MEQGAGGSIEYGGFWRRFMAFWIDVVLASAVLFPVLGIMGVGDQLLRLDRHGVRDHVLWNPFFFIAGVLFVYYRQATPGKMLLGLRVVDARTLANPSFGQALGRQFGYLLSGLVFFLGFVWIGLSDRKQGWHDLLAGTVVIRSRS